MEEFELKHVEFARCIRSFDYTKDAWETLSAKCVRPGYGEFARRQADFYKKLHTDVQLLFEKYGEERLVKHKATITDAIQDFRDQELSWFRALTSSGPVQPSVESKPLFRSHCLLIITHLFKQTDQTSERPTAPSLLRTHISSNNHGPFYSLKSSFRFPVPRLSVHLFRQRTAHRPPHKHPAFEHALRSNATCMSGASFYHPFWFCLNTPHFIEPFVHQSSTVVDCSNIYHSKLA